MASEKSSHASDRIDMAQVNKELDATRDVMEQLAKLPNTVARLWVLGHAAFIAGDYARCRAIAAAIAELPLEDFAPEATRERSTEVPEEDRDH